MSHPYPSVLLAAGLPNEVSLLRSTKPNNSIRGVYGVVAEWHVDESVRIIRGDKMQTWDALYDEVSAAFQFPLYFGRNIGALSESLREPDQEPVRSGRVCIIVAAELVLIKEPEEQMGWFISCLQDARRDWTERPPEHLEGVVPVFSTVLVPLRDEESARDTIRQRWSSEGAVIEELWL
jgi:hypothetical protein